MKGAEALGVHLLVELGGVAPARLSDEALARRMIAAAAERLGVTIVRGPEVVIFPGGGLTAFAVLAESHISMHTFPERGLAAIDVFTCGERDPELALPILRDALGAERASVRRVVRTLG